MCEKKLTQNGLTTCGNNSEQTAQSWVQGKWTNGFFFKLFSKLNKIEIVQTSRLDVRNYITLMERGSHVLEMKIMNIK